MLKDYGGEREMNKSIMFAVVFVAGMMLAHYQSQQWIVTKAEQTKAGYVCQKVK